MISYDDFKKVEIKAGKILTAEKIPNTDKLLRLTVDFAETIQDSAPVASVAINSQPDTTLNAEVPTAASAPIALTPTFTKLPPRQIVSGISTYFPDPAVLIGRTCMFVTNLEPRMIKGFESNGMILAVSTVDGKFSLLEPNETIPPGTAAK